MGPDPGARNKRQYERLQVVSSKHLWDLSEGGAFVITATPRRVGSLVHFEYRLGDGGAPFKALAKVIRALHKPNPKLGQPAGMALQFIKVSDEDLDHLRQYLKNLKHAPWIDKKEETS